MICFIKSIIRRLQLSPESVYKTYDKPELVGGYAGWYENNGTVIAFVDTDNRLHFNW